MAWDIESSQVFLNQKMERGLVGLCKKSSTTWRNIHNPQTILVGPVLKGVDISPALQGLIA